MDEKNATLEYFSELYQSRRFSFEEKGRSRKENVTCDKNEVAKERLTLSLAKYV
jgi:hypothetical protein